MYQIFLFLVVTAALTKMIDIVSNVEISDGEDPLTFLEVSPRFAFVFIEYLSRS